MTKNIVKKGNTLRDSAIHTKAHITITVPVRRYSKNERIFIWKISNMEITLTKMKKRQ